ncbi:MAG TPA: hypothetical protein VGO37_06100 [Steroidobacteraceae bacterium]|nr:hypothetical protein [Steroidobacteraceae bacterium]
MNEKPTSLDELLKSETARLTERAVDVERLRIANRRVDNDAAFDAALEAEAERHVQKAAELEHLRQIEARLKK